MKLAVSFFNWGPSCQTDRARSPFFQFRFIFFILLNFYFWSVFFFSLVPNCTTTQRRFSLRSSIHFFAAHSTFWGSNDCAFPVLPLNPLLKSWAGFDGSSSMTISSQRCRHTRSLSSHPCPAHVFMLIFGNIDDLHKFSNDFFRSTNPEWPKARAIGWQLVLDFLSLISCWERDEEVEKGDRDGKKTETASIGCSRPMPTLSTTLASVSWTRSSPRTSP